MPDSPRWILEPVRRDHVRDRFDCGNADLNGFLSRYARQSDDLGLARTIVAVPPKELIVLGYYSMRNGQVKVSTLPQGDAKRFPRYPVPVVHLARLAVDRTARGQGLGEFMLLDALEKALAASRKIAAYAVEVVAVDETARSFYRKYGFKELLDDRLHLYLPMQTVERLFEKA